MANAATFIAPAPSSVLEPGRYRARLRILGPAWLIRDRDWSGELDWGGSRIVVSSLEVRRATKSIEIEFEIIAEKAKAGPPPIIDAPALIAAILVFAGLGLAFVIEKIERIALGGSVPGLPPKLGWGSLLIGGALLYLLLRGRAWRAGLPSS